MACTTVLLQVMQLKTASLSTVEFERPSVLKRVNAFVGSVADMEYIKPQQAVDKLRENLMRIH